jgi:hypothetical protein
MIINETVMYWKITSRKRFSQIERERERGEKRLMRGKRERVEGGRIRCEINIAMCLY